MSDLVCDGFRGKIIFLNGASSSGKTTVALELQRIVPEPFLYFSFDHFVEANILPMARIRSCEFHWNEMRESVFEAYHRCLRAMAEAGCNVLAEHIIETETWRSRLQDLLGEFDAYIVAIRCSLDELARREIARGDRPIGDAVRDAATCYDFCKHDLEVDSALPATTTAKYILDQWLKRDASILSRFRT